MKKAEMKVYKERLLDLRARLRGDVLAMADAALHNHGNEFHSDSADTATSPADGGGEVFDQEFTLNRVAAEENTLGAIESALERIEGGVYGCCVECEGRIPKARLNALPFTPYCVKCASKFEGR